MLRKGYISCALAVSTVLQIAATPAPAETDFSDGFNRLVQLGLPPIGTDAKWSTLPDGMSSVMDYRVRMVFSSLKGNGWFLPSPDSKNHLTLSAGSVATSPLASTPQRPSGIFGRKPNPQDSTKPNAPPTANLEKDIGKLITTITKKDDENPLRSDSSSGFAGTLLILATQIHQSGDTKLANQLTSAIFSAAPSREAVIDEAVNHIADHAYQSATSLFFQSGDWKSYADTLNSITARFPRGWSSREAVALFLPQLEKQAAGETPSDPVLPGTPLDPRAIGAFKSFTQPTKPAAGAPVTMPNLDGVDLSSIPPELVGQFLAMRGRSQGMTISSPWLLGSTEPTEEPSELSAITALGMAAIPTLAALLDDPFLTQIPNPGFSSGSSYYSSNESESDRIIRLHSSMNRPATRGEIARQLLLPTLPDPDDELDETDPESLRELALEFWNKHKDSTQEQIAIAFLQDGSSSQVSAATSILAKSAAPSAHEAFETHILASDPAIVQFQAVQTYLTARKAAAKPFFDQYAKLVRSQTPEKSESDEDDDDSYSSSEDFETSWRIKQAGGPAKILRQLESLVAGKSPRAIAKQIAKGNPEDAETEIQGLAKLVEEESPTKQLYAFLEGAVATDHPQIRSHFLSAASEVDWSEDTPPNPESEDATPTAERSIPEAEIKVWKKLIADSRPAPDDQNRRASSPKTTLGDLAIAAFIANLASDFQYSLYSAAPILRKPLPDLFREQTLARLEGKPIPPLPDASKVTPERLQSMISQAASKPPAEIHDFLTTLSADERAAWLDWTNNPATTSIPEPIKQLALTVVKTSDESHLTNTFPDAIPSTLVEPGFAVTKDQLLALLDSIAADPAKHSRTAIVLHSTAFGPGLESSAAVIPIPEPVKSNEENTNPFASFSPLDLFGAPIRQFEQHPDASAILTLSISSRPAGSFTGIWTIQDGKLKPASDDLTEKLNESFKGLSESEAIPRLSLQLQFITRQDAEKLQQSASDE